MPDSPPTRDLGPWCNCAAERVTSSSSDGTDDSSSKDCVLATASKCFNRYVIQCFFKFGDMWRSQIFNKWQQFSTSTSWIRMFSHTWRNGSNVYWSLEPQNLGHMVHRQILRDSTGVNPLQQSQKSHLAPALYHDLLLYAFSHPAAKQLLKVRTLLH